MSDIPKRKFFSTVPISQPVIVPFAENYDLGGFAWSHEFGMIVKMTRPEDSEPDILKSIKNTRKNIN